MRQKLLLILFLCSTPFISAQKNSYKVPDSLRNKTYDYLDEKIYELKKDSTKAAVYLYTYLHKAKNEKNWEEVVNGYKNLMHQSPDEMVSKYADSMVYAAKKSNNNTLIGSAFLTKGIMHYSLKQQNSALDNYIIANNYISKTNDNYLIYKLKYHISLVKNYLGYYDEAIQLLKECVSYFKNKNPRAYLNSLHSLGLCYNKIGNYGLCTETNTLGLEECKKRNIKEMEVYFIHSEGINEYFKKDYASAIKKIESSIEELKGHKDFANESVGYFYIGKSYWEVKNYNRAIPYFEKVDQLFNSKGYLRPDLREVYELFIDYYKNKDNLKLQLYYINQLLKADTILHETFKYLVGKINKEYNTKELLIEKEKLQTQLLKKKYDYSILIGFTSLLFISVLFLTYRNLKNEKVYKLKFDRLMIRINNVTDKTEPKQRTEKPANLDINAKSISSILKQLEKFEKDHKFLEKDWSLDKLSVAFNSNTKYLSKIIHHYKDKIFTEYINDLKIDYVISLLYSDKKTRNFTNKALAEEAGFSTTEKFVKAFKAKIEMPPAFFIEQIKKDLS
jgi:AraC-like DNA-binding protein